MIDGGETIHLYFDNAGRSFIMYIMMYYYDTCMIYRLFGNSLNNKLGLIMPLN